MVASSFGRSPATAGALISTELTHFALVFGVLGVGFGGFQLSAQNLVLEFGHRDDLPMRIGVGELGVELVGALGPLLAGALAALISYNAVFACSIAFQLGAIAIVVGYVDEPRNRTS